MITADELLNIAPKRAIKNYKHNQNQIQPDGIINGQKSCDISNHRLGLRKMSANGCGAIAVYNALVYSGYHPNFNVISLGIDIYALSAKGIFGTSHKKLDECLKNCRIASIKAVDYDDFIKVMGCVRVGILCYWVAKPKRSLLHFVAVINNFDGTYSVCNRYSNRKTPSKIDSIEKLCTSDRFVDGYFIN